MLKGGKRLAVALNLSNIAHMHIVLYPTREIVQTTGVFHLSITIADFLKLKFKIAELGLASLCAECEGKHVLNERGAIKFTSIDHKFFLFQVTVKSMGNVWYIEELLSKMKHEI